MKTFMRESLKIELDAVFKQAHRQGVILREYASLSPEKLDIKHIDAGCLSPREILKDFVDKANEHGYQDYELPQSIVDHYIRDIGPIPEKYKHLLPK